MLAAIFRAARHSALGLVLLAAPAAEATAQVNPFRHAGLELTQEDMALIETASKRLYAVEQPIVGSRESWANAHSRNSGTVTLASVYTWNALPCRRLDHRIVSPTRRDPFAIQIDRCRTPDGEWKIR